MTQNCSRVTAVFVAMFLVVFMASSAMAAIQLGSRSQEMTANSTCDLAGTITLTFPEAEYDIINTYLGANDAAVIRVSLSGTDIPPSADVPRLCEPITGTVLGGGLGAQAGDLPDNLVDIQTIDVEVSDVSGAAGPNTIRDVTAYVIGTEGSQYFTIYITGFEARAGENWADPNTWPWIKVGLFQDLIDAGDHEHTAICGDVHDFSGLSKLTVSLNLTPNTLTYTTADNQIGHFLVAEVDLRDCDKVETCANDSTETIELCPREALGQAVACEDNFACFVIDGDLPPAGTAALEIRSNGAANGDNTQSGVYITSVRIFNEVGGGIITPFTYFMADGTTVATVFDCDDESEQAAGFVDMAVVAAGAGNEIRVCVTYEINPDEAAVDTDVIFWVELYMPPCGTIISGSIATAALVECGGIPSCMYFPYVLAGHPGWFTGIVVTNLSQDVPIANMEATFTLTDVTGAMFQYTKSDFDSKVWSFGVDNVLSDWGWTPAVGNAWLYVQTNFEVDGYEFLTDGVFGAGTLPRLIPCD